MTKLWITEYTHISTDKFGNSTYCPDEPGTDQTPVDFSSGAAQSAAFAATTRFIRIQADVACHVLFGANPTATTNSQRVPANQYEYKGVIPGQKLSVISA